jgi:N-methylhydantoinase B
VSTHLSNVHLTPIEIVESEFPCRVTGFEIVPDTGGPGKYRGGLAVRRSYQLLEDAVVVRRYDRARFGPSGIGGGRPGHRSLFELHPGTEGEQEMPASGRYELKAGDTFFLQSAGGGGYGNPAQRDPQALARDVAEGYVSRQGAERDYEKPG